MARSTRNWARASKLWFPIGTLPRGGTPVVLANDDQSVQWFVETPTKTAIKHVRHTRDGDGLLKYHPRKSVGEEQRPVTETVTLKPAWWSPAVYVDDHGYPVYE